MKKTILITISVLLLTACTQQKTDDTKIDEANNEKQAVTNNPSSYNSKELNISFQYPENWKVEENKNGKSIRVTSPNNWITITIPGQSFDEYEKINKEYIQSGKMSVKDNYPTDNKKFTAKEYGQEGGLNYLIKIDENFVEISSDYYLDQKQKEELDIILNSISL